MSNKEHDITNNFKIKGIIAFIIIAFGVAWAFWIPLWLLNISPSSNIFQIAIVLGAFAPALGTIIVRRWVTREGFSDAGLQLNLRSKWPYYLFAWIWPFIVLVIVIILAIVVGLIIPWFSLPQDSLSKTPSISALISVLIITLVFTPILWGEEFGWRSYLQIRLFSSRPLLAAVATGAIWGVWHYPAVFAGYLPNEHGLFSLALFPVYTILFSIILGWLRLRTNSIWPPTLAHSANNLILAQIGLMFAIGGNNGDLPFYPMGVLLLVSVSLLCIIIVINGSLYLKK